MSARAPSRGRDAVAAIALSTVVGLCAGACPREPQPPEPALGALPASIAQDPAIAAAVAIAVAGPITAARMTELPAPAAARPKCVERADPSAGVSWPVVIDRRGDVFSSDSFEGQLVLQPAGSIADARVVAAVPIVEHGPSEELGYLAVDDATLFFTSNLRNFDASEAAWAVRAVPRDGGAAVVIARGEQPDGFAASLAVDASHVYFLHHAPRDEGLWGTLWRVDRRGGEPVPLARDLGGYFAWVLAGDEIFYHSAAHQEIRRVPTSGGEPRTVIATSEAPARLLVAGGSLYFTAFDFTEPTRAKTELHALDLEGAPSVRTLARFDGWGSSVRHDGESVYWAEFTEDSIDSPQRVLARTGDAPPRVVYEPIGHSEAWEIHEGKVYWGTIGCIRVAALVR